MKKKSALVKIKLDGGILPQRVTDYAAGWDLYVPCDVELRSVREVIDLGFVLELPQGYAATIQPRSGFSSKGIDGILYRNARVGDACDVMGSCSCRLDADVVRGLVDSDYRGHVGVIIRMNTPLSSGEYFVIKKGTRIAQMQFVRVPDVELSVVDELDMCDDRGGGFGHTGSL